MNAYTAPSTIALAVTAVIGMAVVFAMWRMTRRHG